MHIWHGMAGGGLGVEADIASIGLRIEPLVDQPFHRVNALNEYALLRGGALEKHGHYPTRDHEHLRRRHGKRIDAREAGGSCAYPARLGDFQNLGGGSYCIGGSLILLYAADNVGPRTIDCDQSGGPFRRL